MVNAAAKNPIQYDYSENFNYAAWSENTVLTMTNVPWNSDYRDIVQFSNQAALDNWINSQSGNETVTKMSLLKFNRNVTINTPLNTAMRYNYARASNPAQPVVGDRQKNYYYFIQDFRYINPNATELVLQLDVWQTFGRQVTFGQSYVERGHIGIANSNAFNHYGRDYLTVPEGMDIGGEYRTVHVENEKVMDITNIDSGYSVLVVSAVDLTQDAGTVSAPVLVTSHGGVFQNVPSGASLYLFTPENFLLFMSSRSHLPWVTEGILSITLVPNMTRYYPGFTPDNVSPIDAIPFGRLPTGSPSTVSTAVKTNWRDSSFFNDVFGPYAILKKLFTFPYMVVELTTFTGSPVIIKPESWQDANATIVEASALIPPGQRIVFMPKRYNADSETLGSTETDTSFPTDDYGEYLDFAAVLDNFPSIPLVNNMALSFLASNKNGLAFQFTNASWEQNKALHGASATYDIANAEIANRGRQAGIANSNATDVAGLNAMNSMNNMLNDTINSAAQAGLSLPATGKGTAGVGGMLDNANNASKAGNNALNSFAVTQRQNQARGESATSSIQAAASVRDTNVGLARFSAKGDYANQIAGVRAKIQDAKMTQPSTSGQFGGDAFNLINNLFGYSLRFKTLNVNALKTIGNYWLRYGYAIDQWITMPSNLLVMSKFTYWKLSESYISQAPIPEMFKQTIRGIFEKGVTVWADPGYIGTTALTDNAPLTGVSY